MQSLSCVLIQSGQPEEAMKRLSAALDKARALGARRYETSVLCYMAECALYRGQLSEGLQAAQHGVAISREVGMGVVGPYALAVLARVTDDSSIRAAALAEDEMVLHKGSVGHNRVWHYRVAGDAQIEARNLLEADQCTDQLHAVTAAESLPFVEFIVARIKALSAVGRGERVAGLRAEIDHLIEQGNVKGHHSWLPSLNDARETTGVCERRGVGQTHGEPKRPRSRKRRAQPRRC